MRINIYSDLNALQGKVPTCVVQPVNLPGGVHIESVAQFLPAQSMRPGFSLTLLRNGEFFLLRSDFNEV